MKDNRLLKVLWGIVLAIFLCSALFLAISYFSGGDNASKKKTITRHRHLNQKIKKIKRIAKIQNHLHLKKKVMKKNIVKVKILITLIHLRINHLITTLHQIIDVQIIVTITIQAIRKMIKHLLQQHLEHSKLQKKLKNMQKQKLLV